MAKRILFIPFFCCAMVMATAVSYAAIPELGVFEQVDEKITISVNQSTVTVLGASGQTLQIVSLTGNHVASFKIESPAQRIELNIPKGCYIFKVGSVVRKVTIR